MTELYVGLMSGTSLDAIDCVVVDFSEGVTLLAAESFALSDSRRSSILELCQPGNNEIDKMGRLDRQLGIDFASAVEATLNQHSINSLDVVAIGSHGQTIRHRPSENGELGFTLQIGDPNTIAYLTGIDTIADFRRKDIAAGGQGAPLVPAFHHAMFADRCKHGALLNIGGMANISLLDAPILGFDTGPGNVLIDHYCRRHFNADYDDDGRIAASGHVDQALLERMMQHPFLAMPAPKSCGRENFDQHWVEQLLRDHAKSVAPVDLIATLTEFTAKSICLGFDASGRRIDQVIVCGGGAFNQHLCQRIQVNSGKEVVSSDQFGVAPQWMEAIAFAWFAMRTLKKQHSNAPSVTGAAQEVVLGAMYSAR